MNNELAPSLNVPLADDLLGSTSMRIEAEDMTLVNYVVAPPSDDIDGQVISLLDKSTNPPQTQNSSTAQRTFKGEDGIYSINLSFFNEVDGQGRIVLRLITTRSAIATDNINLRLCRSKSIVT